MGTVSVPPTFLLEIDGVLGREVVRERRARRRPRPVRASSMTQPSSRRKGERRAGIHRDWIATLHELVRGATLVSRARTRGELIARAVGRPTMTSKSRAATGQAGGGNTRQDTEQRFRPCLPLPSAVRKLARIRNVQPPVGWGNEVDDRRTPARRISRSMGVRERSLETSA